MKYSGFLITQMRIHTKRTQTSMTLYGVLNNLFYHFSHLQFLEYKSHPASIKNINIHTYVDRNNSHLEYHIICCLFPLIVKFGGNGDANHTI